MNISVLVVSMILMLFAAYTLGRQRSLATASRADLQSLPFFYGFLTAMWAALPGIFFFALWIIFEAQVVEYLLLQSFPEDIQGLSSDYRGLIINQIYNLAYSEDTQFAPDFMIEAAALIEDLESKSRWLRSTVILMSMAVGAAIVWSTIHPKLRATQRVEKWFRWSLFTCSSVSVLATVGIVLSVLAESLLFFKSVPVHEFLFGLQWSPQGAFHPDQVGSAKFGAVPLFLGTLMIAGIAMAIAVPTGLMSAIYLSEYASKRTREIVKPALEMLAGIPTVVYGFLAALTIAPMIRDIAVWIGIDHWVVVSSESALAAGLVMGVMIIPFISSLADDVISAVPQSLRDGSLGLGATSAETILKVVLPAALPGVVGGVMLAASRAIGETMIVVMAAGMAANLTTNPLDSMTTVTVQMVSLLVGDQEFDSPKTLAAFALGLMLFLVTLFLNYIALRVVRRYREQYD